MTPFSGQPRSIFALIGGEGRPEELSRASLGQTGKGACPPGVKPSGDELSARQARGRLRPEAGRFKSDVRFRVSPQSVQSWAM